METAAQALGDIAVCRPTNYEKPSSLLAHLASEFKMQLTESTPWNIETNLRHTRDLVFSISRDHVQICNLPIFDDALVIDHGQNGPHAHLLDGE